MILLYVLLGLLWVTTITFIVSQIILPMFTDYKFFWIFTYFKIKRKYKDKLDKLDTNIIEKELKDSINKRR